MHATIENIISYVGEPELQRLSNDTDGDLNTNIRLVQSYIEDNSNLIDSYIREKYTLPITDPILTKICVVLVICDLYDRRFPTEDYQSIKDKRASQMKILADIRDGKANLAQEVTTKEGYSSGFYFISPAKDFTTTAMGNFNNVRFDN